MRLMGHTIDTSSLLDMYDVMSMLGLMNEKS